MMLFRIQKYKRNFYKSLNAQYSNILLRNKKCFSYKVLPYLLHLAMIAAVALYVFVGAITIRRIEAVAVQRNSTKSTVGASDLNHGADIQDKTRITNYNSEEKMRNRKECMIETMKQRGNSATCDRKHIDELAVAVYDSCFQEQLQEAGHGIQIPAVGDTDGGGDDYLLWSLMDSVVFCFTVITTIGYGNVAPKTVEGRLFVIAYGILGIPFTMLAIASLGKFLEEILNQIAKLIARSIRQIFRRYGPRMIYKEKEALVQNNNLDAADDRQKICDSDNISDSNAEEKRVETWGEALTLFVAFFIYIIIGSMVIASYEPEMDFFGAVYFNFVSLTTIGLGDLVPRNETFLALTLVYSAVGLALTTIAIEIAAEYLKMLHYFGRKIDNVANVQIWFGGKKLTMKQLVRNLGDHFNLPVNEIAELNLDEFVDAAIKVEAGELATLRAPRPINVDIESMMFMDADESYMSQSYATNPSFSSPNL